jgi:hypothetical protein
MSLIETDFLGEEGRREHRRHRRHRRHHRHHRHHKHHRQNRLCRPGSGYPGGAVAQSGQDNSNNAIGNLVDNTNNSSVNIDSFVPRARREFVREGD